MPRLAGIDIPEHKKIAYSLQAIYGVGPQRAALICKTAQVDPHKRARDLTGDEVNRIQKALERFATEGDLRRLISENIDRLRRVKAYRGIRHMMGLPVRGQRTKTNARTRRGKRRTVGSMTKDMAAKLEASKTK